MRRIALPDEARELVEAVYGPEARPASGLQPKSEAAAREAQQHIDLANRTRLPQLNGYCPDRGVWESDERAQTRLGEETVRFRLGLAPDGGTDATPLFPDVDRSVAWSLSEVSVARRKLAAASEQAALDKNSFTPILPMTRLTEGRWVGRGINAAGESVQVQYSAVTGLEIHKEQNASEGS